jgi:hypothetical protein
MLSDAERAEYTGVGSCMHLLAEGSVVWLQEKIYTKERPSNSWLNSKVTAMPALPQDAHLIKAKAAIQMAGQRGPIPSRKLESWLAPIARLQLRRLSQ